LKDLEESRLALYDRNSCCTGISLQYNCNSNSGQSTLVNLEKKDDATAMKVLEMIYSKEDAAENFNEIKKDLEDSTFKETIFL
jgi:hypothetical protein